MRLIHEYGQLDQKELREELVTIMSGIAGKYNELTPAITDHHREYLKAYVQEPATSVAAKNRAAEYWCEELTRQIILVRADINNLCIKRDLLLMLLGLPKPDPLPFPNTASFDADGLTTV